MNDYEKHVWKELRKCTAQSDETLARALGEPVGLVKRALYHLEEIGRVESRLRAKKNGRESVVVWLALVPRSTRRRR